MLMIGKNDKLIEKKSQINLFKSIHYINLQGFKNVIQWTD